MYEQKSLVAISEHVDKGHDDVDLEGTELAGSTKNQRLKSSTIRNISMVDAIQGRVADYRRFTLLKGQTYTDQYGREYKIIDRKSIVDLEDGEIAMCIRIPISNVRQAVATGTNEIVNMPDVGDVLSLWTNNADPSILTHMREFKIHTICHLGRSSTSTATGIFLK